MVFAALSVGLVACDSDQVHISGDTAKELACSGARAGNAAGQVSDDMRKQLAKSIADSVSDETVQKLARKVEQSETPEKLRAAFDDLISKACGPSSEE